MDALTGLLDGPRARGAFLLRAEMEPPWSIRVEDESPLTLIAMLRGSACLVYDDGEQAALHQGDMAITRGPDPYVFADEPGTPPQVAIDREQRCHPVPGSAVCEMGDLGVRTWGNCAEGTMTSLIGAYVLESAVSRRVLTALPRLVVVPAASLDSPLAPLLADEIVKDQPGQEVVLDRLLDLLLIAALRAWLARHDAETPSWYRAHGDPEIGRALRLLHNHPARPWTVGSLAAETGLSRAALARRFTELVGEPPMTYLTSWRLTLAADLLREPGATIGAVAGQVGYATPYALSTAFKRVRGVTPKQHRQTLVTS